MSIEKSEIAHFSINKILEELTISIEENLPGVDEKFNEFTKFFNKEFPLDNLEERGGAEALTWALMDGPLALYGLGMNGAAIIELHGIAERFALRESINNIIIQSKKSTIINIIERHTLSDFASILFDLDIFDKDDLKFIKKLGKLRNGLAHKNPKIVSNVVCSGKEISFLDIDSVITTEIVLL